MPGMLFSLPETFAMCDLPWGDLWNWAKEWSYAGLPDSHLNSRDSKIPSYKEIPPEAGVVLGCTRDLFLGFKLNLYSQSISKNFTNLFLPFGKEVEVSSQISPPILWKILPSSGFWSLLSRPLLQDAILSSNQRSHRYGSKWKIVFCK